METSRNGTSLTDARKAGLVMTRRLQPPVSQGIVSRPRVDALLLDVMASHAIVAVVATPGAGKTTAVTEALSRMDAPVAWLTIEPTDAAPGRLISYLEATLGSLAPDVLGVGTGALAMGIAHPEAAGLLAEAAGRAELVLAIDELDRLEDTSPSWMALQTFLRYAPPTLRIVLVSRREIPFGRELSASRPLGRIDEADLAFTADEAALALSTLGISDVDAGEAVAATGGWVTGVLFEAWRSEEHVAGSGGEADPLHGYLSAHILGHLGPEDHDFLVRTALLDVVTAESAARLGLGETSRRLESLHASHLPVAWEARGHAMRCHPRFREYLLERLEGLPAPEIRALRLAWAEMLASGQAYEEATEELLRCGDHASARASSEHAIVAIIERLDFATARRWFDALPMDDADGPNLTVGRLMLAVGCEDYREGAEVADSLRERGRRDDLARVSDRGAALMAWCYAGVGRLDDVRTILGVAHDGPELDAMRYAHQLLVSDLDRASRPRLTCGPLDAFVYAGDYLNGDLRRFRGEPPSPWTEAVIGVWRIGALRATGRTREALELLHREQERGFSEMRVSALIGPDVLLDAGRVEDARELIAHGRSLSRANGSRLFLALSSVMEAKLALRAERRPADALAALERAERTDAQSPLVCELIDTWRSFALLLDGDVPAAKACAARAVESMQAHDRLLELPSAAVYLSEASWQTGDEAAADAAADLALQAADRQGSTHILLQALGDFPAVLSRRLDLEREADTRWHELGRGVISATTRHGPAGPHTVDIVEFGRAAILVDGEQVHPRIAKAVELLARLLSGGRVPVSRDQLLEDLFGERIDDSARAYLRQAINQLRQLLPGDDGLAVRDGMLTLRRDISIASQSARLEASFGEAARLAVEDRLPALEAVLAVLDSGEYLPGFRSRWVDDRRQALGEMATSARFEAAEAALAVGRYNRANELNQMALRADPLREAAWRQQMRIAGALGDGDAVISAYRHCRNALRELGVEPAASTRDLLQTLRR